MINSNNCIYNREPTNELYNILFNRLKNKLQKTSQILLNVYSVDWNKLNILECGADKAGSEIEDFISYGSNCWFVEADPEDFNVLSQVKKNVLNYALSNKNGTIDFVKISNTKSTTSVFCIDYKTLLEKVNLIFDVLVLDVELHEKVIIESWKDLKCNILPQILVIECNYNWNEVLQSLKEIGYKIDCYYFNKCYLSMPDINADLKMTKIYNLQWKTLKYNNTTIYVNEL